jgi:sec-independent protein translocase protein TatA
MISTPGPLELIFLLGLALLVLGPNRLPEAARAAGKAIREMRDALSGDSGDKDDEDEFASRDEEELADAGPAAEASYREAVAGDNDAGSDNAAAARPGTEAGDPAPPPVS